MPNKPTPFVSKKGNIKVDQPRDLTVEDYLQKWEMDGVLHKTDKTLNVIEGGVFLRADNERDSAVVASVREQIMSDPGVASALLDVIPTQPEIGAGVEQAAGSQPILSVNASSSATFPVPNLWDVRMTPGSGATPTVDVYLSKTTGVWIYRDSSGARQEANLVMTGITRDANTCWATTTISWSTSLVLYACRTAGNVTLAVSGSGDDYVQLVGSSGGTPAKVVQMYRGVINAGGGAGGSTAVGRGDADTTARTDQNTIKTLPAGASGEARLGFQNVIPTTTPDGTESVVCMWKDSRNVYQQVIIPTTGI